MTYNYIYNTQLHCALSINTRYYVRRLTELLQKIVIALISWNPQHLGSTCYYHPILQMRKLSLRQVQ